MADDAPAQATGNDPWPTELRLAPDKRTLTLTFESGAAYSLPAEYLRVESPSAEVRGHSPAERKIVFGKRNVTIRALEPVGRYAVRIVFDDGHATGLYTWRFLDELGRTYETTWATYLAELAKRGLPREH